MATGRTATAYPECKREACFAYHLGHCMALTEADFKLRKCPFFKFWGGSAKTTELVNDEKSRYDEMFGGENNERNS